MLDEDGHPTLATIYRYTRGDCWILAYELSRLTNAPLVAIVCPEDDFMWDHVMVDLGRETLLDVEGLATRDETIHRWSERQRATLRIRELGRFTSFQDYAVALDGILMPDMHLTNDERQDAQYLARALGALYELTLVN